MNLAILNKILESEPVFQDMGRTREDSPFHREESVLIHTHMVMDYYKEFSGIPMDSEDYFIGLFACLFHDIGKPSSMVDKWGPNRGAYKSFKGHDLVSARLAEDIMVRSEAFTAMQIYRICWMVEHHQKFWTPGEETNKKVYAETLTRYIGFEPFKWFMIADEHARIRDIPVDDYYIDFMNIFELDYIPYFRGFDPKKNLIEVPTKKVYFPIAASASGKSTICESIIGNTNDYVKTRYDSLRKELYSEGGKYDYWYCIEKSLNDPDWYEKAESIFIDMLESGKNILFDNCNVAKYDRAHQIKLARAFGYEIIAITIPIDLGTLKYRQDHRRTKLTPYIVSEEQYMELEQPSCGLSEFDYIFPLDYR